MTYQQKENSGSLFVNDKKEKDNQPDRTGTALIDGKEYYVSGWLKTTRDGDKWLSLAFKPKQPATGRQEQPRRPPPSRPAQEYDSDGVPF